MRDKFIVQTRPFFVTPQTDDIIEALREAKRVTHFAKGGGLAKITKKDSNVH